MSGIEASAKQLQSQAALGGPPPFRRADAAGKGKVWSSGTVTDAAKIE